MGYAPEGQRVLLIGAGGVARAISFALAGAGVTELVIANRDAAKATELAQHVARVTGISAQAAPADGISGLAGFGLIANATSVGMGGSGGVPLPLDGVPACTRVADVVISPQDTPFIAEARAAGCRVMAGSAMLRPQIELSEIFLYRGTDN